MIFLDREVIGNFFGYLAAVAGQHDNMAYPGGLKIVNRLGRIRLYYIGDNDVSGIFAVNGNVNYCPYMMTGLPFGAQTFHKPLISYADLKTVDFGCHALTGNFGYIGHLTVVCFVTVCLAQ